MKKLSKLFITNSGEGLSIFIKIVIAVLVVAIVFTAVSAVVCFFAVTVTNYTVSLEGVKKSVRAVLITDLHSRNFGKNNSRLLEKIKAQEPDVIFADGDFISRGASEKDVEQFLKLLLELQKIAPVYYAPGNHEQSFEDFDGLCEKIEDLGIPVLNDSFSDVTIAGQDLRIGGTLGHGFRFGRTEEEFEASAEYVFLSEFQNTDLPTVCLAHMPDTFIFNGAYNLWDVDLVLSGHTHGGLVRLPFIGGVIAPMQGLFPDYDKGYFKLGENIQMIISAGLAGYGILPRINNLPEICVIDIIG